MNLSKPVQYHGNNLLISDAIDLAKNGVAIHYQPESGKIYFEEMDESYEKQHPTKAS